MLVHEFMKDYDATVCICRYTEGAFLCMNS